MTDCIDNMRDKLIALGYMLLKGNAMGNSS